MKKSTGIQLITAMLAASMTAIAFSGCAGQKEKDIEPITVYLWSNNLYMEYAPYIQAQLPDIDIQFVVGNNDLDFYKFMEENGALPDIITCRRFSLHDASQLKDQLMDLSTTEEAGAVYESYLGNFTYNDGTINWLPLCAEVDGFVINRGLFEENNIPMPTDYESLVSACKAFEKIGIRGFAGDFYYDYTCMEVLQGLSIPELTSMEGKVWRQNYESPSETAVGLDDTIWPAVFERMETFIKDVKIRPEDLELGFNGTLELFREGNAAIIRSGGASVTSLREQYGIDAVFMPYFGQNGEEWLLTYPAFQVALNKDLENNKTRKEKALEILHIMLSEEGQNILAGGSDVISYNQNVELSISPLLDNLKPLIQKNHLFIRIASNDFFSVSHDVVRKMIQREYNAKEAYEAFNNQLMMKADADSETTTTLTKTYSNRFHKETGNESYSVMAHTIRDYWGSDVVIAPATSFTGCVLEADYNDKMLGYMIMPNALNSWQSEMTGEQLRELLTLQVEGKPAGYRPFNYGSLPTVSGITIEVNEGEDGTFTLGKIMKDGAEINPTDTFKVTTLVASNNTGFIQTCKDITFTKDDTRIRENLTVYFKNGGTLSEPESYIMINSKAED